jgi:hypothetical protein
MAPRRQQKRVRDLRVEVKPPCVPISGAGDRRLTGGIIAVLEAAIGESASGIGLLAEKTALVIQTTHSEPT